MGTVALASAPLYMSGTAINMHISVRLNDNYFRFKPDIRYAREFKRDIHHVKPGGGMNTIRTAFKRKSGQKSDPIFAQNMTKQRFLP